MKTMALTEDTAPALTQAKILSVFLVSRPQSSALMIRTPLLCDFISGPDDQSVAIARLVSPLGSLASRMEPKRERSAGPAPQQQDKSTRSPSGRNILR